MNTVSSTSIFFSGQHKKQLYQTARVELELWAFNSEVLGSDLGPNTGLTDVFRDIS
jgi:hypothetical protein